MKASLRAAAIVGIALVAAGAAHAGGDVRWNVSIGLPFPVVYQQPQVVVLPQPQVVYQQPQVVYQQPQVVYQQPQVIYTQPQVVYAQPPVVYQQPRVVYQPQQVIYSYPSRGYRDGRHYRDDDRDEGRHDRRKMRAVYGY